MHRSISWKDDEPEKPQLEVAKELSDFMHEDQYLWNELLQGCEKSFAALYQRYFMDLYRYGLKVGDNREVVKDCIHDLYVDLWNKKNQLQPVANVKQYLLVAVKRRLINQFHRSKKVSTQGIIEDHDTLISLSRESEIIDIQTVKEKRDRILKALNLLTERQQKAIRLKFYHNYSNQEIASALAIDINSTYNLMSKAMKRLRNSLTYLVLLLIFG